MVKRTSGELLLSITVDRTLDTPVTTQVYSALRKLINSGDVPAGKRLPSSRTLSIELGVSRTTTMAALERLQAEGLVYSKSGSGSYVSDVAQMRKPGLALVVDTPTKIRATSHLLSDTILEASSRFVERLPHPRSPRAFVTGVPDYNSFPLAIWARLTAKHWREEREYVLGYSNPEGDPRLRRAIAEHLSSNRGISCDPEQIFIVNGAQQAFDLIGRVLINPGDRVWFENPGAIGARNSLIACGASLVPIPVDEEGMRVAEGLQLAPDFRLAFVTPSHQHPTGVEMSMERRSALLAAAYENDAWIIEDDYDGEFRYDGRPLPTLKSGDKEDRVIYVGTFSKSMFPSLRLGFYIAPRPLVPIFRHLSAAFLQGVPLGMQSVLASFFEAGHFVAHIRRMREIYAERHTAFYDAAQQHLGGLLNVRRSHAGFHTVGYFASAKMQEAEIVVDAAAVGLTVSPLERFRIGSNSPQGLVLGVTAIPPRAVRAGVETLARVLEPYRA